MESETSTLIFDAMLDIYLMLQPDRRKIPVQIVGESKYLDMSGSMTGSFKLDGSVGRNTRAIITYSTKSPPNITVVSPTGRKYCSLYPEYYDDSELHQVQITVPALAEVGRWTYNIVNDHQVVSLVSFLVMSSARSDHVTPLQFSGALLVDNSSWPVTAVVTAEAVRDRQPVRDVRVTARVTRPAAEPVELQLFDNGIGADILAGDGIYSRYFTHFTTAGLYTASIEMVDDKGEAIAAGDINTDPSMVARTFTGSVRVEHPKFHSNSNQSMDECPPMRITDLRVLHTSQSEGLVVLSWTAPGDDADNDRASSYTLLMASDAESMVTRRDLPEIDPDFVVQGNLKSPKHFGEKEQVTLKLKTAPDEKRSFVFSVFAVDEGNNKGEISNLVTVGLGFVPDISTPEYLAEVTKHDPDTSTDSSQKNLAIAVVVGISAGLLAVTIVTTFCIHFVGEMKRKSLENKLFHSGTNSVV
ncbi:calcium-activated chloride channel regulator 2-like [Physella acuta]|uniref:calcium-activated chloride channel regulator 2-like n=1 Tax=Physella acuta TaxID=109671 RepID=UPI0027DB4898|nr:calcium-activated chloride channel regulator 2-like [Physella acuta]